MLCCAVLCCVVLLVCLSCQEQYVAAFAAAAGARSSAIHSVSAVLVTIPYLASMPQRARVRHRRAVQYSY